MWYQGMHFQLSEVEGLARQQWQEPTMQWCSPSMKDCRANFTKIHDLSYCRQYLGPAPQPVVKQCEHYDARELPITLPNGILIPTYIETFRQRRQCKEDEDVCERKFAFVDANGMPQTGEGE